MQRDKLQLCNALWNLWVPATISGRECAGMPYGQINTWNRCGISYQEIWWQMCESAFGGFAWKRDHAFGKGLAFSTLCLRFYRTLLENYVTLLMFAIWKILSLCIYEHVCCEKYIQLIVSARIVSFCLPFLIFHTLFFQQFHAYAATSIDWWGRTSRLQTTHFLFAITT